MTGRQPWEGWGQTNGIHRMFKKGSLVLHTHTHTHTPLFDLLDDNKIINGSRLFYN